MNNPDGQLLADVMNNFYSVVILSPYCSNQFNDKLCYIYTTHFMLFGVFMTLQLLEK